MSLQVDVAQNPFPWSVALLASHQNIQIDWLAGKLQYDGKTTVEDIEGTLAGKLKGKETALPSLPTPLTPTTPFQEVPAIFNALDDHLALRTFLAGRQPGFNDFKIWASIKASLKALGVLKQNKHVHLTRWYNYIDALPATQEIVTGLFNSKSQTAKSAKAETKKAGTVEAELPNAVEGKVTVRFAPEPSGYLHIGHIKACILNRFFADKYKGKFILRFDDTNPEKEEDEFESSFEGDLQMLGVGWDKVVHTSDHFDKIQDFARRLIQQGDAFMDDTDQQTMRDQRKAMVPSKRRDESIEDNMKRFEEMLNGTEEGQKWFMRAKIDHLSPNGSLRDPAVYRCVNKPHHITGDKFKAYPMYDMACPIVDSLDGVTHALRANEYADRKPQYEWFLKKLGLAHIEIFDFSRIDFVYTVLSKRKLKYLVEQGRVATWEDPRFPTLRGMRARGLTVEALKGFIASQGASSSNLLMEWDQLWAWNKKVLDPIAPRFWALAEEDLVKVHVNGGPAEPETRTLPAHKKNPEIGDKKTVFASDLLMEQYDAALFGDNEEITAMDWGNAYVRKIAKADGGKVDSLELELHLEGDVKKTSKKVHWLPQPASDLVPVTLIDYDYLINKKKIEGDDDFTAVLNPVTEYRVKALADANVVGLKKFDIIQFERKGFYIYQGTKDSEGRMEFGFIPDGRASTVALKGKPFEEDTTKAVGKPGEKGWGKDMKATKDVKNKPKEIPVSTAATSDEKPSEKAASETAEGKVYLSDATRGFEIVSKDKMYKVDRIYGNEEVVTPNENVNMYKVKSVYGP